jgi:hypothetical protein
MDFHVARDEDRIALMAFPGEARYEWTGNVAQMQELGERLVHFGRALTNDNDLAHGAFEIKDERASERFFESIEGSIVKNEGRWGVDLLFCTSCARMSLTLDGERALKLGEDLLQACAGKLKAVR